MPIEGIALRFTNICHWMRSLELPPHGISSVS